jgi:tryptophan-rich sensory protein
VSTDLPFETGEHDPPRKGRSLALLAPFLFLSAATLAVGGLLNASAPAAFYENLRKPSWTPPGFVFGPAWTLIMTCLAFGVWRVALRPATPTRTWALWLYALQLLLNVAWSGLFFGLQAPRLALAEIAVLDAVLLGMTFTFRRVDRAAAWLLSPYIAWMVVANALNVWIAVHN